MKILKKEQLIVFASILIIAQYVLTFFVLNLTNRIFFQVSGWLVWLLSLYFGFAPIFILKKWGKVKRGQSYVHTTQLVLTNLYGVVRHPQYLAGILFSISLILLSFHWLVALIGVVASGLIYIDIQEADKEAIEKFGESYRDYIQIVPQVNFILGIYKKLRWKKE